MRYFENEDDAFDCQVNLCHKIEKVEDDIEAKNDLIREYNLNYDLNEDEKFDIICQLEHERDSLEDTRDDLKDDLNEVSNSYKEFLLNS